MILNSSRNQTARNLQKGLTIIEVTISVAIAAMTIIATVGGYVFTAKKSEMSGYALAAQSLAVQGVEQTRACKWDLSDVPIVDELVSGSFPPKIEILDLPITGTNVTYATNFTTIGVVSTDPPLKSVRVDCVWRFSAEQPLRTNTIVVYRGPDAN